ncbi:MAG: hypothetical protein E6K82_14400 [Candidatus Rokuibacteriota bacterium]|nr:MAG: hypothetical protein E6K82_14400 [Candidatus Rokubacteria bacterium]
MTEAWLTLLQFADGLFPAGGFAHSFGLETYVQEGVVRDRAGLEAFVTAHLEGSAGPADAVAAAGAVRQAAAADVAGWMTLDERLEAMKAVPELRAASRQMGRQTLRVAAALGGDAFLATLARAVDDGLTAGHHAPVFGAALGRAGVEPAAAAGVPARLGLTKRAVAVGRCRGLGKRDMIHNDALPRIEVDPETYEVRADGEVLMCEPARVLPMAQRYFLF